MFSSSTLPPRVEHGPEPFVWFHRLAGLVGLVVGNHECVTNHQVAPIAQDDLRRGRCSLAGQVDSHFSPSPPRFGVPRHRHGYFGRLFCIRSKNRMFATRRSLCRVVTPQVFTSPSWVSPTCTPIRSSHSSTTFRSARLIVRKCLPFSFSSG